MSNEIKPINTDSIILSDEPTIQSVHQSGEKNVFASRIDNMNVSLNLVNSTPQILQPMQTIVAELDRGYYNLFVTDVTEFLSNEPFVIEPCRALTEYMDDDLKREFSTLSETAQEKIKKFPCLFANENRKYGSTDEEQLISYGFITQIKVRMQGIKIYPQILFKFKQQRVNEAAFDFGLNGSSSFNELNRSHWSIKKIDLLAEIRELGYAI